ncbi:MAG TPA: type II secretion system F family protein [Patescibacteria group bacterium]|nr:type II secretion system F family protein [Patescibacteria group bacterium]
MTNPKNITLSNSEKLGLISNFATMLAAGIAILEVVDSLLEDSKGNQKKILEILREDLSQGNHMSTSFEKFPKVFDKITVNLIKASEEAGTLDVTLKDLKETIKKDADFRDKIKGAVTYPAFVLVVFVGVLLMILIVVVPKISSVFIRLKVPLPLPTQILIFASNLLVQDTIYVVPGILLFIAICALLWKSQKSAVANIVIGFPVISELVKEIDLTRFTRSLFLLLNAGIPISNALELAQEVVVGSRVKAAITHSKEMVVSGKKLSEGLKEAKDVFPSIMVKITEAGEKSGSLDKSMQDASEFLDYQVSATLRTFTALLEPLMLVIVGVLVGGMMLAIIAPIYGLIGQVGGH